MIAPCILIKNTATGFFFFTYQEDVKNTLCVSRSYPHKCLLLNDMEWLKKSIPSALVYEGFSIQNKPYIHIDHIKGRYRFSVIGINDAIVMSGDFYDTRVQCLRNVLLLKKSFPHAYIIDLTA